MSIFVVLMTTELSKIRIYVISLAGPLLSVLWIVLIFCHHTQLSDKASCGLMVLWPDLLPSVLLVPADGGCLCQLPNRSLEPRKLCWNSEAGGYTLVGQSEEAGSKLHHSKFCADSEL